MNKPKFRPMADCVLVDATEFKDANNKTKGGIEIVESLTNEKPDNRGRVIAVGNHVKDVKIGDVIVFPWGGGVLIPLPEDLKEEGHRQFMITEKRIMAVIDED